MSILSSCTVKKISVAALGLIAAVATSSVLAATGSNAKHHQRASAAQRHHATSQAMRELDSKYRDGVRITAPPFLGTYTLYDTNALLVNQPSMNEDLVLLEQHALLDKIKSQDDHFAYPASPLIDISGAFEPAISYNSDYSGKSSNSIAINRAEIDLGVFVSPWITGYMSLGYKGVGPDKNDVVFNRAWITVGNLNRSPLYFSVGQMYVPFGSYSSAMLSNPITKTMFRTNAPTAVVGLASQIGPGNLYAQTFAYQGPSSSHAKTGTVINGWGGAVGYKGKYASHVGYDMGVSYINNIANAGSQQSVADGANQMVALLPGSGFAGRRLAHNVGGIAVHLTSSYDSFAVMGEWISGLDKYAATDMQYQGAGAEPSAMHIEGDYSFSMMGRNSGAYLGYDHSWQALALAVPEQSIAVGVSSNIWHYTTATLEYRHDINYKSGTAAGIASGIGAANNAAPTTSTGGSQNTVSLQLGLYF